MGILIAKVHPAQSYGNLADHTYVMCGKNKGWRCWGTTELDPPYVQGTELRRSTGSTKRADCIAGPDQKAGIKCYLINGVCHQAANRILSSAEITVRDARGYSISHSLFGTYGRPGIWACSSPFNKCEDITGDLPECIEVPAKGIAEELQPIIQPDEFDKKYIKGVLQIYSEYAVTEQITKNHTEKQRFDIIEKATELNIELFMYMTKSYLGSMLDERLTDRLKQVRLDIEKVRSKIEEHFAMGEVKALEFVKTFNEITLKFQDDMANSMTAEQYLKLFDLNRDERVILADPDNLGIVSEAFLR